VERTYRNVMDRSGWPSGPWDDEPEDKVQWIDEAAGLDCLAVRNRMGSWCGYVGVPSGHPAYGQDYDEVDVEVHGGLTYAARCQPGPEGEAICHVPASGRTDDIWWLGFDTSHFMDLSPHMLSLEAKYESLRLGLPRDVASRLGEGGEVPVDTSGPDMRGAYRSLRYVREECRGLAAQLAGSLRATSGQIR
jgi:hypothetical protein